MQRGSYISTFLSQHTSQSVSITPKASLMTSVVNLWAQTWLWWHSSVWEEIKTHGTQIWKVAFFCQIFAGVLRGQRLDVLPGERLPTSRGFQCPTLGWQSGRISKREETMKMKKRWKLCDERMKENGEMRFDVLVLHCIAKKVFYLFSIFVFFQLKKKNKYKKCIS